MQCTISKKLTTSFFHPHSCAEVVVIISISVCLTMQCTIAKLTTSFLLYHCKVDYVILLSSFTFGCDRDLLIYDGHDIVRVHPCQARAYDFFLRAWSSVLSLVPVFFFFCNFVWRLLNRTKLKTLHHINHRPDTTRTTKRTYTALTTVNNLQQP